MYLFVIVKQIIIIIITRLAFIEVCVCVWGGGEVKCTHIYIYIVCTYLLGVNLPY